MRRPVPASSASSPTAFAWPGTSNVNWYTNGQILAVTTVTAVDATAKVTVHAGGPGSTQFVIDVIGYYA